MVALIVSWFFPPYIKGVAPQIIGYVLLAAGVLLLVSARRAMGPSFTVMPKPRAGGELITTGPFQFVRNPIYLAVLLCLAGGSLLHSWTGLALTGVLAVVWAAKARVEERYLAAQFPEYTEYAARVRYRLVPFVY
jgi:protein-S-isoprenylcysteine O-methyltransferase Ste14